MVDSDAWSPTTARTGSAGRNRLMTKVTSNSPSSVVATDPRSLRNDFIVRCSCHLPEKRSAPPATLEQRDRRGRNAFLLLHDVLVEVEIEARPDDEAIDVLAERDGLDLLE